MENNKRQTAVEWLENEIFRRYKFTLQQLNCGPLEEAIQQAKEMEKEQIIDAYRADLFPCSDEDAEQYYNETYGRQTED